MIAASRSDVWLSHDIPADWEDELEVRELGVSRCEQGSAGIIAASDAAARCVAVTVPQELGTELASLWAAVRRALDNGLRVTLVVQNQEQLSQLLALRAGAFKVSGEGIDQRFFPSIELTDDKVPQRFAQEAARHNAGPADAEVELNTVGDTEIHEEDRIVLRRALSAHKSAEVECLQNYPGKATRVYRIRAYDEHMVGAISYVIKTTPRAGADRETGVFLNTLPDNTPFANVPPLDPFRSFSTSRRSSITTQFVDRAHRFEEFIATNSPALAVASLFDGPLRCWRSRTRVEVLNVAEHAFETVVRKNDQRYAATCDAARLIKSDVRPPQELVDLLLAEPARPVPICFSHGDLHLKNIFVRGGSYETVLIDFNRAGFHPSSRDPAELDAALGFSNVWDDTQLQESLYSVPLLSERILCRTEFAPALAIEQLRRQIAGTIAEDEYRIMLACHCFYWAAKGSVPAYLAIDRLV